MFETVGMCAVGFKTYRTFYVASLHARFPVRGCGTVGCGWLDKRRDKTGIAAGRQCAVF